MNKILTVTTLKSDTLVASIYEILTSVHIWPCQWVMGMILYACIRESAESRSVFIVKGK